MSNSSDPAVSFIAVTPHDTTNITNGETRALYVGVGGDVACINAAGTAVTFVGVPTGTILPVRTTRVNATSTDADSIVALY